MNLPDIQNTNVRKYLDRAEIVMETAAQIMKDFGMFGVEITFSGDIDHAYEELHRQLVDQVGNLLNNNAELLMSVLYQVDISDREIARATIELPDYDHVEIVAHQIIFRDLKKVLFRRYYKGISSNE